SARPASSQKSACMPEALSGSTHSNPKYLKWKLGWTKNWSIQPLPRKRSMLTHSVTPKSMRKAASQAMSVERNRAASKRAILLEAGCCSSVIVVSRGGWSVEIEQGDELRLEQGRQVAHGLIDASDPIDIGDQAFFQRDL